MGAGQPKGYPHTPRHERAVRIGYRSRQATLAHSAADPDVHAEAIGSVSRLVGEPVTGVMMGCYGIDFSIRSAPRVLMMSSGRLLTIRRSV